MNLSLRSLSFTLATLSLVLIGGCANKPEESDLQTAAKLYVQAVRWGQFGVASKLIKNRDDSAAGLLALPPKGLRVAAYDYRVAVLPTDPSAGVMQATFKYYFDDSAVILEAEQQSEWWYDQEAGQWWMEGALPRFYRR